MEAEDLRLAFEPGPDMAMGNYAHHVPSSQPATPISTTQESLSFHHSNSSLVSVAGASNHTSVCKTPPGRLSLHHYRKILSQADSTEPPDELKGRTLKRKAATLNLNPAKNSQDSFPSLSSPTSSAPSSPPPLSFSQSLQSLTYPIDLDFELPTSPVFFDPSVRLSLSSPVSLPAPREDRSDDASNTPTRNPRPNSYRLNAFRERLRERRASRLRRLSHRRSSSDSALLRLKLERTILHDGASFEIINPRDSLELTRIVSSPEDQPHRSSETSPSDEEGKSTSSDSIRTAGADGSRRPSTAKSMHEEALRTSSSSSSSLGPKFPSATPGLLEVEDPFSALPHLTALPGIPAHLVRPGSLDSQPGKESFDDAIRAIASNHPSLVDDNVGHHAEKPSNNNPRTLSSKISRLFRKKSMEKPKAEVGSGLRSDRMQVRRVDSKGSPLSSVSKRRSSLLSDTSGDLPINQHQPNYNSASGRIDKSSTIEGRIRRKPGRRTLKKRPSRASVDRALHSNAVRSQTSSSPSSSLPSSSGGGSGSEGRDNPNTIVETGHETVQANISRRRPKPEDSAYRANRFHSLHSMQSALVDGNATYRDIIEFFLSQSSPGSNSHRRLSEELSWLNLNSRHTSFQGPAQGSDQKYDMVDDVTLPNSEHELYPMTSIFRIDERASQSFVPYLQSNAQLSIENSQGLRDSTSSVTTVRRISEYVDKEREQPETSVEAQAPVEVELSTSLSEQEPALSHAATVRINCGPTGSEEDHLVQTSASDKVDAQPRGELITTVEDGSLQNRMDNGSPPDKANINAVGEDEKKGELTTLSLDGLPPTEATSQTLHTSHNSPQPGSKKASPAAADVDGRSDALGATNDTPRPEQQKRQPDNQPHKREESNATLSSFHRRPVYEPGSIYHTAHSSVSQRSEPSVLLYPTHQVHPAHRDLVKVEDQPLVGHAGSVNPSSFLPSHVRYVSVTPSDDQYQRYRAYAQPGFYQAITVPLPRRDPAAEIRTRPATASPRLLSASRKAEAERLPGLSLDAREVAGRVRHRPSRNRCNFRMLLARACC